MDRPLYLRTLPMPSMPMSQQEEIDEFWRTRQEKIEKTVNFRKHAIPKARVKSIICSQKGSMMMAFDMPAFLSKLCELFVQELTIRAWMSAQSHGRCIILDSDIAKAVTTTESYDFLLDILHSHQVKHKKSIHQPRYTRKHRRTIDSTSTSHPLNHIPSSMPMISQYMPFSLSFLLKEAPLTMHASIVNRIMAPLNCLSGDDCSFGNDINKIDGNAQTNSDDGNNSIVPNIMSTGPLGIIGTVPDITGTSFCRSMNNINSIVACGASRSNSSNSIAQKSVVMPASCFNPPFPIQPSFPLMMPNNNNHQTVASTIELDDSKTTNATHKNSGATINSNGDTDIINIDVEAFYDQQQLEIVDGTSIGGNGCTINLDDMEIANDFLLENLLEEFKSDEYSFSPYAASTDIPFDVGTMFDDEELNKDPCIVNVVISNPSTNSGGS